MNSQQLVNMANRIAEFFAPMPNHEEAVSGVANHIVKFWEPRMRKQFLQDLANDAEIKNKLHPIVLEAVTRI